MASNKENKPKEQRQSKRFDVPLDIEYRTLTQNPIFGNGMVDNISRGGIGFEESKQIPEGVTVQLKMNVPGDNLPVFAMGTVAWADGLKKGVRLTKISNEDQERILECIYQRWLKNHKVNSSG